MNPTQTPVTFNGDEPALVGETCTGLVVQSCYDAVRLVDPANVTFMRFGATWHRIHFEPGIVFWRSGEAPVRPVNASLASGLIHNDLADHAEVVNRKLLDVAYSGTEDGDVHVSFRFEGDSKLELRYGAQADATQIKTAC